MVEEVATGLPLRRLALEIAWADGTVDRGDRPYTVIADRLATQTVPPKTGAPSPGLIAELVSEALQSHDGVLVICPASDLSSTYASARLGARDLPS